ncbi:efflux transporter, outer membrane factor (OMF) lipoprotein, NodT family [Polynucleobacter meluiroseus]|uniref:Efflux transporter, outer membrane factor (OMF) lipoprotein, NodT family n=1 Tax=Polynucleobacter meluiroseus TaxID=1938814 RepID=A0A240E2J7_9BURK|nr:efflux transporter outer membrane subunit [Polynucleobacter meluiroseus]SNX28706.1 efflux transporter, outer membrane factor (OMF) lipoprotein, NodT family [Polynucleobacter meluiroseus]
MKSHLSPIRLPVLALVALGLVACSPVGPDYVRPSIDLPETWKSNSGAEPILWSQSNPRDVLPKQDWWTIFGDQELDALEAKCLANNPSLQAAVAKLDQAKAQYGVQFASFFPTVQAGALANEQRISANRPLSQYGKPNYSTIQNNFSPYVSASYEFDWIGKIQRSVEAASDTVQQAQAAKENTQLILTGQLAQAYFRLRQFDEEIATLKGSLAVQEKVLTLITKRHDLGASSEVELVQQAALTQSTMAQIELLQAQRNELENLVATLAGIPAAGFQLASGKLPENLPKIPLTVPSTLLERRPDIASAERAMAAANAQIGVAKAAYYPMLTLSPTYLGFQSNSIPSLLTVPSLIWSFGVNAVQSIFDGGRISSGVDYASAGYTLAVANYRQTVLSGIQDAQDALSNVQQLNLARASEDKSVANLNRAYQLSFIRYRAGLDTALTLALIQQNQLTGIRLQSQIKGSQFTATVGLIKALGGSWETPITAPEAQN